MIQVKAVPTDDTETWYAIECSECGPMGLLSTEYLHGFCTVHLVNIHGATTTTRGER